MISIKIRHKNCKVFLPSTCMIWTMWSFPFSCFEKSHRVTTMRLDMHLEMSSLLWLLLNDDTTIIIPWLSNPCRSLLKIVGDTLATSWFLFLWHQVLSLIEEGKIQKHFNFFLIQNILGHSLAVWRYVSYAKSPTTWTQPH